MSALLLERTGGGGDEEELNDQRGDSILTLALQVLPCVAPISSGVDSSTGLVEDCRSALRLRRLREA